MCYPSPVRAAGLILAVVLLVVVSAPCILAGSPKPPPDPQFEPDITKAAGGRLDEGVWIFENAKVRMALAQVEDEARRKFIEIQADTSVDPFTTTPGKPRAFMTWVLIIENKSDGELSFQPQTARLITFDKTFRQPLDLPALQSAYEMLDRELPAAYLTASKAIFDGEKTIRPRERKAGLLAYRPIDAASRSFIIELSVKDLRGEEIAFVAPYRRMKKK